MRNRRKSPWKWIDLVPWTNLGIAMRSLRWLLLAAILYLGCGIGLALFRIARRLLRPAFVGEARPSRADWPWLLGAIFFGGVLGPILLLTGLSLTAAATTSLLLNLESVFTALIAWFVFREGVDFATAALDEDGSKVLIHCAAGVHRAPMMALALLCRLGWTLPDAMALIETRRPVVDFPEVYVNSVKSFLEQSNLMTSRRTVRASFAPGRG